MRKPGTTYDPAADAMYILINPDGNFDKSREISESVILDVDLDGEVIGIEILSPPSELVERFISD